MGPDPAVAAVRRAVRLALIDPRPQPGSDGTSDALPGDRSRPLLVALSGGPDSLALAAATAFVADRDFLCAGAVIVDHGLQDGSAVVAARAASLAYELGLDPVLMVAVDVIAGPASGGPEAAARVARYRALDEAAAALNAVVLLGHTRDDQAETVLLGLGRGSGPRSIAGMRRRQGRYLRPFLDVDRATTVRACAALGLPVWHDPHNLDPSFRRVRLRREVLPLLEDVLGGGVAAALARTADLLRADVDALDHLAAERNARERSPGGHDAGRRDVAGGHDAGGGDAGGGDAGGGDAELDLADLAGEPEALRARALRNWAISNGAGPLTAAHVNALTALTAPASNHQGRPGRQAHLPGGYVAVRRSGRLQMHRIEVHSDSHRPG
jgi:tRNA(Ile)-lysidine synthase